MSDNKEANPGTLPVFPDIMPSSIKRSEFHNIEDAEIETDDDLWKLLRLMYEFPEREFYLFTPRGQSINAFILGAERAGIIRFEITEFHFYQHPNYKHNYVRIQEMKVKFDWERDLLRTAPMYMRTKLSLSDKGRRQFELQEMRKTIEDVTANKHETKPAKRWSYASFKKLYNDHEALWWVVAIIISIMTALLVG